MTFGSGSISSFRRTAPGGTVNFSNTANGTIAAPLVTLDSTGLIGAWATIGDEISGSGALDYATVSGGNIVPYSTYNTGAIATWTTSSNVKVSSSQTIPAAVGINSIYLTGAADVIGTGTAGAANTITLGNGGILSNIGTGTYTVNGNRIVTNATELGGNGFSAGTSGNKATVITTGSRRARRRYQRCWKCKLLGVTPHGYWRPANQRDVQRWSKPNGRRRRLRDNNDKQQYRHRG